MDYYVHCHGFDDWGVALLDMDVYNKNDAQVKKDPQLDGTPKYFDPNTGPIYFEPNYVFNGEYRSVYEISMDDDYGYDEDNDLKVGRCKLDPSLKAPSYNP